MERSEAIVCKNNDATVLNCLVWVQEAAPADMLSSLQRLMPGLYCLLSVLQQAPSSSSWGFTQVLPQLLEPLQAAAGFLHAVQEAVDTFDTAILPELAGLSYIAKSQSLLPVSCSASVSVMCMRGLWGTGMAWGSSGLPLGAGSLDGGLLSLNACKNVQMVA